jgi:hypothetical protein
MSKKPHRRRWPVWRGRRPEIDLPAPPAEAPDSETEAVTVDGIQRAIGVMCAGLDSTELQTWAMDELIPRDGEGLSDFLAALYVMARVLLGELGSATGQSREEILQRLALRVANAG